LQQQQQSPSLPSYYTENNDIAMLAPERLRNLLAQIDPIEKLDADVEEVNSQI
jgi:hypothetical protein